MRETLLDKVKVGEQVVYQDVNGRYSFAKVESRTETNIKVGGKTFYRPKSYGWISDKWIARKSGYSSGSQAEIHPNTEEFQKKVRQTELNRKKADVDRESKQACDESDAAEMKAYLATEEGKVFTALVEDWVGAEIRSIARDYEARATDIFIYRPDVKGFTNDYLAKIEVRQNADYDWDSGRRYVLKRVEIRGQSGFETPLRAEKYLEAFKEAIRIASLWDKDAGKTWDRVARVALDNSNEPDII